MQVIRPVRGSDRCVCWLSQGRHILVLNPRTGRTTCQQCGGDGERAMRESDEFQQAWTEYAEEDFYHDIDVRDDTVPTPSKLVIPRFIKRALRMN